MTEGGDAGSRIVEALTGNDVEFVFFTSGSEIGFYQEAISRAELEGRRAPKLITVLHEHAALNAALGYAAVGGKPAVTAAHVDVGTLHHGGAIHTAHRSGLPVLITAGSPPTAAVASVAGARDAPHLWLQETYDQSGIVRQYVKWEHLLKHHDDPAFIVSRALQVACSEPCGPVYLSIPREVTLQSARDTAAIMVSDLAIPKTAAPDPDAIADIARRLVRAENPFVVVSGSGRDPATVPALVGLCEVLGAAVVNAATRSYLSFPMNHPLFQADMSLAEADFVLALEAVVPWMPGRNAPGSGAFVATVDHDPLKVDIPTYDFPAHVRLTSGALAAIRALHEAVQRIVSNDDRERFQARAARWAKASAERRERLSQEAAGRSHDNPISPIWLSSRIAKLVDDNSIVIDDTLVVNRLHEFLACARPRSYFFNPGSSGGWAPGAALGAKLAAPERDVIAVSGDGYYTFGTPNAALWTARHYNAPFLMIVYQNRSYSTGTTRIAATYPDGFARKNNFPGGYFDPPIDLAKEAEAAGAAGETVRDPGEIDAALRRAQEHVRRGIPALVSVWLPRLMQAD
ncbi:MAG: thiamine pyrophosphate-requiring protein [Xanthobacteraceae bacterium]|nr:thiamine pyrophosphate-requiring protein [Xanthobacteraceae bacterium]